MGVCRGVLNDFGRVSRGFLEVLCIFGILLDALSRCWFPRELLSALLVWDIQLTEHIFEKAVKASTRSGFYQVHGMERVLLECGSHIFAFVFLGYLGCLGYLA